MKPKPALSAEAKKAQKTPLSKIFAFFGAIFFVALVLGGTFITFVILNTNDVSDVRFFSNLGIRLQDINDFLSGIVTFIFSLLGKIKKVKLKTIAFLMMNFVNMLNF